MKIKGFNVELTVEEVKALRIFLGNFNDPDYLKYAESLETVYILKNIYKDTSNIVLEFED